jgi:hypothetical protein
MATNTYVALDLKTVSSAVSSVTFTGISAAYTDLIVVSSVNSARAADLDSLGVRFNADTTSNYSYTIMQANTSTGVTSGRSGSATSIFIGNVVSNSASGNFSANVLQIMNYANASTFKTVISRGGGMSTAVTDTEAICGLWRKTPEAITSVTILSETGSNFNTGSTFALYGIAREGVTPAPKATGGAIYSDSTYYYHVFGSTGIFTPLQSLTCDYLVVAGGGGGSAGGGGAGGLRSTVGTTGGGGSLESALSLTAQAYTITVGAGGAGGGADAGTGGNGTNGGNSSIAGSGLTTVTSTGGGGGAKDGGGATAISANNGGSGGGLGWNNLTGSVGIGTANQGYNGGGFVASGSYAAGGGGGAGNAGQTAPSGTQAGAGGTGVLITGFATATGTGVNSYYAGGGGAGIALTGGTGGAAGAGGGGTGGNGGTGGTGGTNAVANTGGGGGGRTNQGAPTAYNGGSGLVIFRYAKA